MNSPHYPISAQLNRYLRNSSRDGLGSSPTTYIEQGAEFVGLAALNRLHTIVPDLRRKARTIKDSLRLRKRLEILVRYFAETPALRPAASATDREIGFVLIYFIKNHDLIPDSIPEIGFVDDSLLVETVIRRQEALLQAHWLEKKRVWPENW